MFDLKKSNYSSTGQWFFMATIVIGVITNNDIGISIIHVGIIVYCSSSLLGYYKKQTLHMGVIELEATASDGLKKFWFTAYLLLLLMSMYGLIYGY